MPNKIPFHFNPIREAKTMSDLMGLFEFSKKIFKDQANWLSFKNIQQWFNTNNKIIALLEDSNKVLHGYSICIPIAENIYFQMKNALSDIREFIIPVNILNETQALQQAEKNGNYLYVAMVARDLQNLKEDYKLAVPLFLDLRRKFEALKLNSLICQTESEAAERVVKESGCIPLRNINKTKDGQRVIWYFDLEVAKEHWTTGLGEVMAHIWLTMPYHGLLRLRKREKEIVNHIIKGKTIREIAKLLDMNIKTVKKHIENILDRAEKIGLPRNQKALTFYLAKHPEEILGIS